MKLDRLKVFRDIDKGYILGMLEPCGDTGYYRQASKWYKRKGNLMRYLKRKSFALHIWDLLDTMENQ